MRAGNICDYHLLDLKSRCCEELEDLVGNSINARQYDEATLSLHPAIPRDLLVKRSKARVKQGSREDALNDANKVGCSHSFRLVHAEW